MGIEIGPKGRKWEIGALVKRGPGHGQRYAFKRRERLSGRELFFRSFIETVPDAPIYVTYGKPGRTVLAGESHYKRQRS